MGIRNFSIALAAGALIATSSMAAAPVRPSVAPVVMGTNLASTARLGATKSRHGSDIVGGAVVIGALAVAAGVGGVVAGTSGGSSSTSPE